jgi:MoaA/NifB/PqqE/SkfB family radical SAM enzyme
MSKLLSNARVLHLEPTDVCQAECPQCAREIEVTFNKNVQHRLTVETLKSLIPTTFIQQLDKMFMCGNYGDPAAGYPAEIFEYFRSINPDIVLGMHTNGGIGSTRFWKKLATIINKSRDYVIFSIDGLADTNHIYRKNVLWNNIINNAKTFIDNGGNAHWEMIVFEHNEHQIADVEQLARRLGFKILRYKVSKRHIEHPVNWLNPPKNYSLQVDYSDVISCQALKENSVYLSARGIWHPCCWMGHNNGPTVEEFDGIQQSWNNEPNLICKSVCSIKESGTNFTNQWKKEIILN